MPKAVLVMDMPESCVYCPLSRLLYGMEDGIECVAAGRINRICKVIPYWCPLRELPEKMEVCGTYNSDYYAKGGKMPSYKTGWNACLDEILKHESED